MVVDCDYVMDYLGRLCIVKGYWHTEDILANVVYLPMVEGERFNPQTGLRYTKVIDQHKIPERIVTVKKIFYPRECYQQSKESDALSGTVWGTLGKALEELGIPSTAIGIFGSYLLGFPVVKDVDFVIYGTENCRRLRQQINVLRQKVNATGITKKHISYQIEKHAQEFDAFNSFEYLLGNKWSSLQIAPGILSTLRFVYEPEEVPKNPFCDRLLEEKELQGTVRDDFGTHFCPRTFVLDTSEGRYLVATYFWIYQSCVSRGMRIIVRGNLREGKVMTLDKYTHGIKVL